MTATGWPAVEAKCRDMGIGFRWWQASVGKIIMAKRADGKYAATIGGTGLSVCRQVGKTFLVGAIMFALCLLRPGFTVIWTAHRVRTAEETFGKMRLFARRLRIAPYVGRVVLGSGEEAICFTNGSRILFGARESGFGLGFDEVDALVFDEAQRLRLTTLDDMVPAANQSRQPGGALMLFLGTPPRADETGEVFTRMREDVLSGEDENTGWVELGADPGFVPTPKPAPMTEEDWRQVAKANPSFPADTPRESILRMRKQLSVESFPSQGLGIWDDAPSETVFAPVSAEGWHATARDVRPDGPPCFFVTIAKGMRSAFVAVAASCDGVPHVGVAELRDGVSWLTGRVKELAGRYPDAAFAAYSAGPVKSWVPALAEAGVELRLLTAPEAGSAYAHLAQAVEDRALAHSPAPELSASLAGSVWREVEGGGFALNWSKSEGDPSLIAGVAGALWVLDTTACGAPPSFAFS